MPTTTATFTVSSPSSVTITQSSVPSFVTTSTTVASFSGLEAVEATFSGSSSRSPFFDPTLATFSVPAGVRDVIAGSSLFPTSGPGTQYLGLGTAASEGAVQLGVPQATAKRLFITRDVAPGVGTSIAYTLRKNGVDTGIVVTLSGADTSAASSPTETVGFLAGDKVSIKQAMTGSVARGMDNFVIEFQLA